MDASPFPQVLVDTSGQTLKKNAVWHAQLGEQEPAQLIHPVDWAVVCQQLNVPATKINVRARRDGMWQTARVRIEQQPPHFLLEWDWLATEQVVDERLPQAEMLGGIVHSFNNYLSAMMGFAELAMLDLPPTHAVYGQLQTIVDSGQQASGFTRQLLLSAGRAVLQKQAITWPLFIVDQLDAQGIRCSQSGESLELSLDLKVLREVLNLLAHYLKKYSSQPINAEAATIDIRQESAAMLGIQPGRYAVLRLTQQGKGFSQHQCEKLFQPYFFNSLINDKKGLGLTPILGFFRQLNGTVFAIGDAVIGNSICALIATDQSVHSEAAQEDSMLWCICDQTEVPAIIQSLLPPGFTLATMSAEQAISLLQAGYQPPILLSTSLSDITTFRDIRTALHFPHLVWTPFADKRPVTEDGVIVLRADWSGETLRQAIGLVLY